MRPLDLAGRVLTRQISQAFLHEIPHHRIAFIRRALGCRNAEMQAQAGIGDDHVVEDVVRVTHPCDLFPSEVLQGWQSSVRCAIEFEHRQQVSENLCGMETTGKRVDDWHSRLAREAFDLMVSTHTRHDAVNHRADNARRVQQTFVDAQLDVRRREEHAVAAKGSNTRLTRNASTSAALAEDDRDRLAL